MSERQALLDEASRHCDIAERLPLIPPSARSRGIYFRSIETVLTRSGHIDRYRALFPERFAAILWHPTAEFMVRLVAGGAILAGPEKVHQGMFEIGRQNAIAFSESLIGRTLLRLLSRDPRKLLQQGDAARRQSLTYGTWDWEFPTDRSAVVTMKEEYAYIESYLLGAAHGTFDAIGLPVRTEVRMVSRFEGQHLLEW